MFVKIIGSLFIFAFLFVSVRSNIKYLKKNNHSARKRVIFQIGYMIVNAFIIYSLVGFLTGFQEYNKRGYHEKQNSLESVSCLCLRVW